jgi:hypothetical protein
MNPPARLCDQSTNLTLVTLAEISRPSTSKRTVSPMLILKDSLMNCSTETSGSSDGVGGQISPATTRSFDSSFARKVIVYSRPRDPRPRTSS